MARIFLVVAIILTLLSGVVSLQSRSKAKGKVEELNTANQTITSVSAARDKAKQEAKVALEKATDATAKKEQAETQLAAAKEEKEKVAKDAEATKTELTTKTTELADAKKQLDDLKGKPAPTPAPEVEKKLQDAIAQAEEQKQLAKTLESKAKEAEEKLKIVQKQENDRQKGLARPGVEGKVLAVNPSWNFVVLSLGDHQGVSTATTLIVKRGGALVAKLRVTSVEPATSIADILPGSIAKGNVVQPGDVVIFSGS